MTEALDRLKLEGLVNMVDGDVDWARDLLNLFVVDTSERIRQIQQALDVDNPSLVQLIAHTIKGSAASVGADTVILASGLIEADAKNNDLHRGERLVSELECELNRVRHAIVDMLPVTAHC